MASAPLMHCFGWCCESVSLMIVCNCSTVREQPSLGSTMVLSFHRETRLLRFRLHLPSCSDALGALRVWGCGRWGLSAGLGGCCQVVFEASGVDEAADGVVGQVAESQGDAA